MKPGYRLHTRTFLQNGGWFCNAQNKTVIVRALYGTRILFAEGPVVASGADVAESALISPLLASLASSIAPRKLSVYWFSWRRTRTRDGDHQQEAF